ncbi:hypothetical protein HNR42_000751 [Deinobacterium chartae]|uniref:DUF6923 domain-containing protein n=1 Tax=Deinobacterium chartae TaxID=521158 RepID=A0A841HVD1_9DEIO|nr:hypothetical protein [Deinobacterium chartae]MBB6097337.1 hypothetical protein [Deinobacterium chartae]
MAVSPSWTALLLAPLLGACAAPAQTPSGEIRVLVTSASELHSVVLAAAGHDRRVAPASPPLILTDLARHPHGNRLYAVTATDLYRLDPENGQTVHVGPLGTSDMQALAFDPQGQLYGGSDAGVLYRIDTESAKATAINPQGLAERMIGDLAFAPDGTLYATLAARLSDRLVTLDPASGQATHIGLTGVIGIGGLTFRNEKLYGITTSGELLTLERRSGEARPLRRTPLVSVSGME